MPSSKQSASPELGTMRISLQERPSEIQESHGHASAEWSPLRLWLRDFFTQTIFETVLVVAIIFNMVLVAVETDYEASGSWVPVWVEGLNYFFGFAFAVELSLRLFTFRSHFFKIRTNQLDLVVVGIDVFSISTRGLISDNSPATMRVLRCVRLVRLFKAVRAIRAMPQAHLMVSGIFMAMKSIACGMVALLLLIMPFSILAVQLIQPVNEQIHHPSDCVRCREAFSTVSKSFITLFQTNIIGDGWGLVTVPILLANPWTSLFFFPVFTIVGLGVLNLITAVIVDAAQQVHLNDSRALANAKEKAFVEAAKRLKAMCMDMDDDQSGYLSSQELLDGFDLNIDFQHICKAMDIRKEDMQMVFSIMDSDQSGEVSYDEFVHQLHLMKEHDSHTLLVFIKHYTSEINRNVSEQLQLVKGEILSRMVEDEHQFLSRLKSWRGEVFLGSKSPETDSLGIGNVRWMKSIVSSMQSLAADLDGADAGSGGRSLPGPSLSEAYLPDNVPTRPREGSDGAGATKKDTSTCDEIHRADGHALRNEGDVCDEIQMADGHALLHPPTAPRPCFFVTPMCETLARA